MAAGRVIFATFAAYLIVLSAYSIGYTETHTVDVSSYIHMGEDLGGIYNGVYVYRGSEGYDGMSYYILSINPFDFTLLDKVAPPKQSAYRYQRILYPLVVHILALGQKAAIPYVLLLVNLSCVSACILVGEKMWGKGNAMLYLPLIAGVFISVLLDLAEPLWILLIVMVYYFAIKNDDARAAFCLMMALFAKETALYILAALVIYNLARKDMRKAVVYSLPLLPFLLWQGVLFQQFGEVPLLMSGELNRRSFTDLMASHLGPITYEVLPAYVLQLTVIAMLLHSAYAVWKKFGLESCMYFMTSALLVFALANTGGYDDVFNAPRTMLPSTVAALFYLAKTGDKKTHIVLIPQVVITLGMSGLYVCTALLFLIR